PRRLSAASARGSLPHVEPDQHLASGEQQRREQGADPHVFHVDPPIGDHDVDQREQQRDEWERHDEVHAALKISETTSRKVAWYASAAACTSSRSCRLSWTVRRSRGRTFMVQSRFFMAAVIAARDDSYASHGSLFIRESRAGTVFRVKASE